MAWASARRAGDLVFAGDCGELQDGVERFLFVDVRDDVEAAADGAEGGLIEGHDLHDTAGGAERLFPEGHVVAILDDFLGAAFEAVLDVEQILFEIGQVLFDLAFLFLEIIDLSE
jgi:hypothetical protein